MEDIVLEKLEEIKELLNKSVEPKQLFSVIEFAELSGMKPRRVRELCSIKGFPCTRDERKIYVHREAFDWIKKRYELPQNRRSSK